MEFKAKRILAATALAAGITFAGTAHAASIAGDWRTDGGDTANISACGSSYCVVLKTGAYAGKQVGKMKGSGNSYKGTLTDPSNDRNYSGTATMSGNSLKMRGCALVVICRTQNWKRM